MFLLNSLSGRNEQSTKKLIINLFGDVIAGAEGIKKYYNSTRV